MRETGSDNIVGYFKRNFESDRCKVDVTNLWMSRRAMIGSSTSKRPYIFLSIGHIQREVLQPENLKLSQWVSIHVRQDRRPTKDRGSEEREDHKTRSNYIGFGKT